MDFKTRIAQFFKRRPRLPYFIAAPFISFAAVLLYLYAPQEGGIYPPCPTYWLTYFYCPGCGTLRALHAMLHLDFKEAVSQNALAVIFAFILPLMALFPQKFEKRGVGYFIFAAIIIFTVLRNIEAYPFCLLAPH